MLLIVKRCVRERNRRCSLTEAIHGYGRAKNRNIGNSVFIRLTNVCNSLSGDVVIYACSLLPGMQDYQQHKLGDYLQIT